MCTALIQRVRPDWRGNIASQVDLERSRFERCAYESPGHVLLILDPNLADGIKLGNRQKKASNVLVHTMSSHLTNASVDRPMQILVVSDGATSNTGKASFSHSSFSVTLRNPI